MIFAPIPPDLLAVMVRIPWTGLLAIGLGVGLLVALCWFVSGVSADLDEEEKDSE